MHWSIVTGTIVDLAHITQVINSLLQESLTDTEMYSSKKCFQARSCKLAIVVSIVVAVVLVIIAASIAIVLAGQLLRRQSLYLHATLSNFTL